ncbi:MAG: tetratricopeptide repeat protein [Candidatus Omnitrophica bacterium]|nr:tetratricopeptide repeat protein [Candidatus Omnitrophota bacterium]
MKRIELFFLCWVCLMNIGWVWHKNPKVDDYMQKGYHAWQVGNLTEAMSNYKQALILQPAQTDALNFLGVIYEEMGLPQKAEEQYLAAISVDTKFLPAYSNLGILYWNQGDIDKSIFYFQKRVELGSAHDPWTVKAEKALENMHADKAVDRQSLIQQAIDQAHQQMSQSQKIKQQAVHGQ